MSRALEVRKLVSVLATSTSTTGTREEALERVPCIYYPVQFKDMSKAQGQALIDSGIEVNAIHPTFAKQLGLSIRPIDVEAQKNWQNHAGHLWNGSRSLFSGRQG